MKYILTLTILILSITSTPRQAIACSCIAPSAPLVELGNSDFVFSGKVKSITPVDGQYGRNLLIKFEVFSKWKGDISSEVALTTADNSAACGYPFSKGKSYLVYGNIYESVMQTGLCTRTNLLDNAGDDLRDLDAGEDVSSGPRCGGPTSAVVFQTFLFLFMGMCCSKRRPVIEA